MFKVTAVKLCKAAQCRLVHILNCIVVLSLCLSLFLFCYRFYGTVVSAGWVPKQFTLHPERMLRGCL